MNTACYLILAVSFYTSGKQIDIYLKFVEVFYNRICYLQRDESTANSGRIIQEKYQQKL